MKLIPVDYVVSQGHVVCLKSISMNPELGAQIIFV